MSDKYHLKGGEKIQPTPFDAHEQAVRGVHVETQADSPDKSDVQEYPKAVDHVGGEPVLVNSREEEEAYNAEQIKDEVL